MQKITAILLLTCLCCTLVGYHLVFHFRLMSVKSEMKTLLLKQDSKDVIAISLTGKECEQLYWEEENEFSYKGKMYDVIEKKTLNGHLIIRCIPDGKETALLNEYQKNNKNHSSGSAIVQLITAQFVLPEDHLLKQPERLVRKNFVDHTSSLQNIVSTVLLPPPIVC